MAWSAPKTWSSGYVVLAADMNNIRDQLNATAPATLTAQGDIVIASGANALARLAKSTTSTQYLANTGTSNAPAWNEVALDTGVSGTLPVANGGTGATSLTANGALIGNGSSAIASVDMSTKGGLLAGDGSGNPSVLAVGGTGGHVLTVDSGETTGIKWAAAGGAGLTLIGTAVASGSATLDITGLDSTYDTYLIAISDCVPAADGEEFLLQFGDSSGIDQGASDYGYHEQRCSESSVSYVGSADSANAGIAMDADGVGNAAGEGLGAVVFLHRPGDGTTYPMISGSFVIRNSLGVMQGGSVIGNRKAVITLDRIRVKYTGGNIATGRLSCWGIAHA